MNIGVVIGRYNTDSNRLEYLLDEKGKYIHFYSVGEASKYLEDNDISTSEQKRLLYLTIPYILFELWKGVFSESIRHVRR